MSGVVGLFHPGGCPVDRAVLERMNSALAHRGGDGAGAWCAGSAGVGQQLRRSTPEAPLAARPLEAAGGGFVLAADARLDNRDELCEALAVDSAARKRLSDEELILKAYERWDEACPERLLGDFAFVIWDARRQRFFCARDFPGVKPLYYHHSPELFACASEIKALLAHPDVPRRLDEERVADYLAMVFEDKGATFYRGVRRLPPGRSLSIDRSGLRQRAFFDLDPGLSIRLETDGAYALRFREILDEAVACRRRSARPHGFLLSGGLDSSSIVCLARRRSAQDGKLPLAAFSASFHDFPKVDEQEFIDAVLADGGVATTYIAADRAGPLHDIDRVLECVDEPFHAPNLFIFWRLAAAARDAGMGVLIDGVDGDTTVSHGLERLIDLIRSGSWSSAASEVRLLARRFGHPARRFLWHYGLKPALISPLVHAGRSLAGRNGSVRRPPTVRAEFARRIGWEDRLHALLGERLRPIRLLKEGHWRAITSGIVPFYLEVHDKAAAAFGIDHRHPFYDRRLIEFCYGIPAAQKMSGGWDRIVQRRAMEGVLPPKIQWRIRKSHWGVNFKRGFFDFDRAAVESMLYKHAGVIADYTDARELDAAYRRCRSGSVVDADGMNLWLAVTLALWLEKTRLAP